MRNIRKQIGHPNFGRLKFSILRRPRQGFADVLHDLVDESMIFAGCDIEICDDCVLLPLNLTSLETQLDELIGQVQDLLDQAQRLER